MSRADRGCGAASSGATQPPKPSAAAPAAIRPRNPRRCVVRLAICGIRTLLSSGGPVLSSRLRPIRDVRRCVAVRPIVDLVGEIRAGVGVHVRGHVERLLVGQRARLVERHVVADERRGGAHAGHPRADVVRVRPPYRRGHPGAPPPRPPGPGATCRLPPGARPPGGRGGARGGGGRRGGPARGGGGGGPGGRGGAGGAAPRGGGRGGGGRPATTAARHGERGGDQAYDGRGAHQRGDSITDW